jgi:lysophospholipase L1-like esterase
MKLKPALISVLLTLLLLELCLALFRPIDYRRPPRRVAADAWRSLVHQPSPVPGLAYELAPDREAFAYGAAVRTNSHGMRDAEPLATPRDSLARIAVIGDSFTFGMGIEAPAVYPQVLEMLLNDGLEAPRYDVLNFGVGGYGARDEALVLRHKALVWNPRLVIIGYALNDPETSPLQRLHANFHRPACWQRLNLLRLVAFAKWRWDVRRLGRGDYVRYLHAPGQDRWRSVESAFAGMRRLTAPRGVPVLLVIFPWSLESSWADYPYGDLHEQVADAARRHGLEVLDLLPVFARYDPMSVRAAPGDPHPSELGHHLCAFAIRDWIVANRPPIEP